MYVWMFLFIIIICISMLISYVYVFDLAEVIRIYIVKCNILFIVYNVRSDFSIYINVYSY